jgi:hypothetical protein
MQSTIDKIALDRLTQILTQEVNLCSELLELTTSGRSVLAGDNVEDIAVLLRKLETRTVELKNLSSVRTTLLRKFALAFGVSLSSSKESNPLNLRKLADLVPEPFASGFRQFSSQLNQLALRIQSAQLDNAYITQRALDYVNITLRLLVSAQNNFGYSDELNQKNSMQIHTLA